MLFFDLYVLITFLDELTSFKIRYGFLIARTGRENSKWLKSSRYSLVIRVGFVAMRS